jgi:hypothetical protein
MRDPLNPFDDVEERVQGPFDEGDKLTWFDRDNLAHRLDGPAVEYKDGKKKIWAIHGEQVTQAHVAAYCRKLEAEHDIRLEAEKARQIDAEAQQYHTGLEQDITVGHALRFKKLPKIWK